MTTIVQIMYPVGGWFDWDYYLETHMPMVARELDLLGWSVLRGVDVVTPPAYQAIAVLHLRDDASWTAGFARAGPQLLADIPRYTDVAPVIQVNRSVA